MWRYANGALEACWLIVAALVPLYVDMLRAQSALARGQLLQVLAVFMALLWLTQWTAAKRGAGWKIHGAEPGTPGNGDPARQAALLGHPDERVSQPAPLHSVRSAPYSVVFAGLAAAYAGTTLLAAALSPLPGIAFWGSYLRGEGAFAVVSYMVLFLVVADRLRSRAQLDRLVSVLLAASVPVCLYGVAQATAHDPFIPGGGGGRPVATAGNAIFLAAYLIMLAPLTVWRLLDDSRRRADAPRGSWLGPLGLAAAVAVVALIFGAAVSRPQGWWAYPMVLAGFALAIAVLPALPADALGQRARQAAYLGLLLLQVLVIVKTASRGPLVGLIVALAVIAALSAWRRARWRELAIVGGLVVIASAGLLALMAPASPLRAAADNVPMLQRLARVREDYTMSRVLVWQRATEALTQPELMAPNGDPLGSVRLVIGYGPESVVYLLNRVLPPPSELGGVLGEFWDRSHNALLDRLLTTGLFGLAAYLALVIAVTVVAWRRAWPTPAPLGWSLGFALAVALVAHLAESQSSLLALPPEAIFWLLAGVTVALPSLGLGRVSQSDAPAEAFPARRPQRAGRSAVAASAAPASPAGRPWPVVAYAAAGVALALVVLQMPPPERVLLATLLGLGAMLAGPLAGASALAPAALGAARVGGTARALLVIGLAGVLALVAGSHQVAHLAAEVAFHRGEQSQQMGSFPQAIRGAQQALALTPDQAEYYHILGQYYGALAGETRTPPLADFTPTLAAVRTEATPESLGQEQLFALGGLSLEEAVRRNPLEARYYATLGELYRYWAELTGQPERLAAAIASFEGAAALKPNDVEIHAGLGDSLLLLGEPARALAEGRRAIALLPGYWYGQDVVARAALMTGDPTSALVAAGNALRYATANVGVKAASPYELERLRQVVAQALATGATPVQPGTWLRNDTSHAIYRVDEQGRVRQVPAALVARCAIPGDTAYPLPDALLPLLPTGPELDGC